MRSGDDVETLVNAAKERPLDRLYREYLAARSAADEETVDTGGALLIRPGIGQVLGVR